MAKDEGMFRVECFVDSDKLGKVLWLLAGNVRQLTQHPVINAKKGRGGNGVTPISRGALVDLFGNWIRERKLTEINANHAREFLEANGRSPQSSSYVLGQARDAGLLKNIGNGPSDSRWQVLAAARASSKKTPTKKSPKRKSPKPRKAAAAKMAS